MEKDRHQEILDHARRLFARYGFRKTTVEDVAKECGLGKAALYHYFENKEDMFAQVVRTESRRFLKRIRQEVQATGDPKEKVRTLIITRFKILQELLLLNQITGETAKELVPLAEKERQDFFREETDILLQILEDGQKQGIFNLARPRLVALSMISAFKGMETHFMQFQDSPTMEEGLNELLNLLFHGICQ